MIYYHLFANKKNIGDYLSALAIKSYLNPVKSIDIIWEGYERESKQKISAISEYDILIIGGGGLFKDYFSSLWEIVLENNCSNIIVWGVGVCDQKYQNSLLSPRLLQSIVNRTSVLTVRDPRTKTLLGSNNCNIRVVGCPSTKIIQNWKAKSKKLLLHVIHPGLLREEMKHWQKTVKSISRKMNIKYYETDHIISNNRIINLLQTKIIKSFYENAALIISSRLHGCIIGSSLGIPIIPVSNDCKIDSYWKENLGGSLVLNSRDFPFLMDVIYQEKYDDPELILRGVKSILKLNKEISLEVKELFR